jgi:hypothetical protein
MMRKIYRYVIPVDDTPHEVALTGPILHVAARDPRSVEFWALGDAHEVRTRTFEVYGTGSSLPDDAEHVGTALAPRGVVWHLVERTGDA